MDQQLLAYIEQELKRGVRPETVKKALCDAGWEGGLVEEAFLVVQSKSAAPLPQFALPKKEPKEGPLTISDAGESSSKKFSTIKVVLGITALAFAAITVYLYLSDSFGATEISDNGLIFESENSLLPENKPPVPPAGGEENGLVVSVPEEDNLSGKDDGAILEQPIEDIASEPIIEPKEEEDTKSTKDDQRKADMEKLVEAQKAWFAANGKYYTCGLGGGDCGGKLHGYPTQIGEYLTATPKDPSGITSGTCGSSYIYCGLNNAPYSHFFCYYAKLEGGGYYTASHEGNFLRQTPPKIFEECAAAN